MGRRIVSSTVLVVLAVAALTTAGGSSPYPSDTAVRPGPATSTTSAAAPSAPAKRPNVVLVLTDDLTPDLLEHMPAVRDLQADGVSFAEYVVADSLCCPSRATLLTGRFAHNTGVYTNAGPDGGITAFRARGQETDTVATRLQASGYATALMGKYLNGYKPRDGEEVVESRGGDRSAPVPPGWSEWAATGGGYQGYEYTLNENGRLRRYGSRPQDYIVSVLSSKAQDFVRRSASSGTPFFLEVSTFTPHAPAVPAPQDVAAVPDLTWPRGPAFDRVPTDPPAWLGDRPALTEAEKRQIDDLYRRRVRSVAAIDRLVRDLRETLRRSGVADDTYVVFTSDNGYHMGEHRLTPGKQTAFDTDVRVPLVVAGPGVARGVTRSEAVQNVDLAPTFVEAAEVADTERMDGRSLLPLLRRPDPAPVADWRQVALVEHRHPTPRADDPDRQGERSAFPPTYTALRSADYLFVAYDTGELEYYDRRRDPDELTNLAGTLPAVRVDELRGTMAALEACRGASECFAAAARAG